MPLCLFLIIALVGIPALTFAPILYHPIFNVMTLTAPVRSMISLPPPPVRPFTQSSWNNHSVGLPTANFHFVSATARVLATQRISSAPTIQFPRYWIPTTSAPTFALGVVLLMVISFYILVIVPREVKPSLVPTMSTQGTHWTIYPAPDRFSLAFGFQTQSFPLDRDFAAYDDVVAICDTLEEDPTWMEMPKSTSSYSKPPSSSKSDMAVIHPHLSAQSSIPPTPHAVNTSIPPPPFPSCIHPFTPRVTPHVTRYFSTKDNRKPRGCVANLRVRGHLPSPKDCPRARGSGLRYTAIMEFMGDCVRKETMANLADLKVLIAAEGKAKSREKLAHVEPSVMRHVYYRPSDDLPVIQEGG